MAGVVGMKTTKRLDLPKWSRDFLSHIDGRSELGYALRKRREALENDISGGEPDLLTYGQKSLICRAIWLECRLGHDESKLITGDPISAGSHATLLNALVACYRTLGIHRRVKRTPSLKDYIAQQEDST